MPVGVVEDGEGANAAVVGGVEDYELSFVFEGLELALIPTTLTGEEEFISIVQGISAMKS